MTLADNLEAVIKGSFSEATMPIIFEFDIEFLKCVFLLFTGEPISENDQGPPRKTNTRPAELAKRVRVAEREVDTSYESVRPHESSSADGDHNSPESGNSPTHKRQRTSSQSNPEVLPPPLLPRLTLASSIPSRETQQQETTRTATNEADAIVWGRIDGHAAMTTFMHASQEDAPSSPMENPARVSEKNDEDLLFVAEEENTQAWRDTIPPTQLPSQFAMVSPCYMSSS